MATIPPSPSPAPAPVAATPPGPEERLTVDATMGWIRKFNIYGANGTVNLLLAYIRVRDAQGVGVTGLRAKDFKVVRLNPWAEHPAGESLPIRYLSKKLGLPDSPAGSYVLNLGTQDDESGPRECALMITVTRNAGQPDATCGRKLVSVVLHPES